jgi:anti-sigma regulatory factor (Ser/Thr protein kinase)
MHTIRVPAALHALPQIVTCVATYAAAAGFPPARVAEIELAVGEALTNICAYAYPQGRGEVEVQCTHGAGPQLCIDIIDTGVPFDPLAMPPPDLLADLEERTQGGLGLLLLRTLVDELTYRREQQ